MIKYLRASKNEEDCCLLHHRLYKRKLLVALITWITLLFHCLLGKVMYAYEFKTKEQRKLIKKIKN